MSKSTALILPAAATPEDVLSIAYDSVADKIKTPAGWMGVKTVNLVDDDKNVVMTYLVKFRSKSAELFAATGDALAIAASVRTKFSAAE